MTALPTGQLLEVPLDQIRAEGNVREFRMDDVDGRGLRDSVRELGVLQPVLLAPLPKGQANGERYRLITGFRRYSAASEAGARTITARVVPLTEDQVLLARITENVQRLNATFLEEASAVDRYRKLTGTDAAAIAAKLGVSGTWVSQRLGFLELDPEVVDYARRQGITASLAHHVLGLPKSDAAGQRALIKAVAEGLTLRNAAYWVRSRNFKLAGGRPTITDSRPVVCGAACRCSCSCCVARRGVV